MALVLRSITNFYDHIFVNLKDPRNASYPLIGDSPLPAMSIVIAYALFCKYGPQYMESRKPFELKKVMLVYNFLQVVMNLGANLVVRTLKSYANRKLN